MSKSPRRFAQILTQAVRRIALNEDKKIQIIQDELGYALGRDAGGSSIEYWRKGHVPAHLKEVEDLARELQRRGGLIDAPELEQFLAYADHPQPTILNEAIFSATQSQTTVSPPPTAPPLADEHPTYVAGPPITHPRYFFGREREIKRLFNLLKRRPLQNAAIIGPRRSGKTSLLHYLKNVATTHSHQLRPGQSSNWLPQPDQYQWVLVDFQDSRLGTENGLLNYLLAQPNLSGPDLVDLDIFMDVVSEQLTRPTIIMFDEIGVALQRYTEFDDSFWEGLRALATNQVEGNLAFVLAAHESPDQLANHNELGSPFFNIFGYTAMLGPFRPNEAETFIAASPLTFPPDDVRWILEQSAGWPILLQILCRERFLTLEEGEIGSEWREDGLQQIAPFRHLLG